MTRRSILVFLSLLAVFALLLGANALLFERHRDLMASHEVDPALLYAKPLGDGLDYLAPEPHEKVIALQRDLERKLHLSQIPSTLERIEVLATYLLNETHPRYGVPEVGVDASSGIEAFDQMLEGRVNVWSEGIARVWVAFAAAAGIPSRLVKVEGGGGKHWFAESYIQEQERWALVDLQYRQVYIRDGVGRAVGGAQLCQALHKGDADQFEVALFEGGGVRCYPLRDKVIDPRLMNPCSCFYFPSSKQLHAGPFGKMKSYFCSGSQVYTIASHEPKKWHRLKQS